MTQKFSYTYKNANGNTVTLTKAVTDRMEERNSFKAGYAARYFTEVLRKELGFFPAVYAYQVVRVK